MSNEHFTPALGRARWTGVYDLVLGLATRERTWRAKLLASIAPQPDQIIADIGCGTGTLAILLKQAEPAIQLIGLDPDPAVLAIAERKAARAQVAISFMRGFARDAGTAIGVARCDAVVSSLMFHQTPMAEKRAGLAAMFTAAKPGGMLCIADYGEQRSRMMRTLFRATVQRVDGRTDTQPNADGILPSLIRETGFTDVREREVIATMTGSISIYTARRPD